MKKPVDGYSDAWKERKLASFVNEITFQGTMLKWRMLEGQTKLPLMKGRGKVNEFSKASRLRLLKYIATVDWEKLGRGLFLTLTYPNEILRCSAKQLNLDRYLIHRSMEMYEGRHLPAIWRIEWKPRLSGDKINYLYPHWHMLIFGTDHIPIDQLCNWWQNHIGSREKPVIWIVQSGSNDHAAKYVAKYASKLSPSLDNAAYLNSVAGGRQWGILRKKDIPLCEEIRIRLRCCREVSALRSMLVEGIEGIKRENNTGFTVFGEKAKMVAEYLFGIPLDGRSIPD
jgi:hypothetical protein